MTSQTRLTEDQFNEAEERIVAALRTSKRGTPERDVAQAAFDAWEAANDMPQGTFAQRAARDLAVVAAAGL